MMRYIKLFLMICLFPVVTIFGNELSFQLIVYDNTTGDPLETEYDTGINSWITDSNDGVYFETSQDQTLSNGVINIVLTIDLDVTENLLVFDQEDVQLVVYLEDYDDTFYIDFTAVPISIISSLADRTAQMSDESIIHIDYDLDSVGVGQSATTDALTVSGTLLADGFEGDGYNLYGFNRYGLADDHSLERLGSRVTANINASSDAQMGVDSVYVSNEPYVGIHTTEPEMALDVFGRVLFLEGASSNGILSFPLATSQSIMVWDSEMGAFKAGFVSSDLSVAADSFALASTAIGNDISIAGQYSSVFGGESNIVTGDYSVAIGGDNNTIEGDYSVSVGGSSQSVAQGYSANIGGGSNVLNSQFSTILGGYNNTLTGDASFVIGHYNTISDEKNMIFNGTSNVVSGSGNFIFGSDSLVSHSNSLILNLNPSVSVVTEDDGQIIIYAKNGLSVNTQNAVAPLTIEGTLKADYFYGEGFDLRDVYLVDPYFEMNGSIMYTDYNVGIETGVVSNMLTLKYGITIGNDGTSENGTIVYKNDDFKVYTNSGIQSLTAEDTDTQYTFNVTEFIISDNEIGLNTDTIEEGEFMVFTGSYWEPEDKAVWESSDGGIAWYRPVSLWSETFDGMLTLADDTDNLMVFMNSNSSSSQYGKALTLKNLPGTIGFNSLYTDGVFSSVDGGLGYGLYMDAAQGGYKLFNHSNDLLMNITPYGQLNLFDPSLDLDANINGTALIDRVFIDYFDDDSAISHREYPGLPLINRTEDGELILRSSGLNSTINFRILDNADSPLNSSDQNRLQISKHGEFLLTDDDTYLVGTRNFTVVEGDTILDSTYSIGTFDTDRDLQQGVIFYSDYFQFVPSANTANIESVFVTDAGLGVRVYPTASLHIFDDENIDVKLTTNVAGLFFSRSQSDQWSLIQDDDSNLLGLYMGDGTQEKVNSVMAFTDLNIGVGVDATMDSTISMNIEGDFQIIEDNYVKFEDTDGNLKDIFVFTDNRSYIYPLGNDTDQGIQFFTYDSVNELSIVSNSVGVGIVDTDYNLTVSPHAYITKVLKYQDEEIIQKEVWQLDSDNDAAIMTSSQPGDTQWDEIATLLFDYDYGFTIEPTGSNQVILSFQDHFSTVNAISNVHFTWSTQNSNTLLQLNTVLDPASFNSQVVTPNGDDVIAFDTASYYLLTITANNQQYIGITENTVAGDTFSGDELIFINDLKLYGGLIDGTLNVREVSKDSLDFGSTTSGDVSANYIIGNMNCMQNVQLPWEHANRWASRCDTTPGTAPDYEYIAAVDEFGVIDTTTGDGDVGYVTFNVGINTKVTGNQEYALEVVGTTSINILQTPTVHLTGTLNGDTSDFPSLNFVANASINVLLNTTTNVANQIQQGDFILGLNGLDFYAGTNTFTSLNAGINDYNPNYRLSIFDSIDDDVKTRMKIITQSNNTNKYAKFEFGAQPDSSSNKEVFKLTEATSSLSSYFQIFPYTNTYLSAGDTFEDKSVSSKLSYIKLDENGYVGINTSTNVSYDLQVSGSMVIGSNFYETYWNEYSPSPNSVWVQNSMLIGTTNVASDFIGVKVLGSMLIGDSKQDAIEQDISDYDGHLISESSLWIGTNNLLNTDAFDKNKVVIQGGLAIGGTKGALNSPNSSIIFNNHNADYIDQFSLTNSTNASEFIIGYLADAAENDRISYGTSLLSVYSPGFIHMGVMGTLADTYANLLVTTRNIVMAHPNLDTSYSTTDTSTIYRQNSMLHLYRSNTSYLDNTYDKDNNLSLRIESTVTNSLLILSSQIDSTSKDHQYGTIGFSSMMRAPANSAPKFIMTGNRNYKGGKDIYDDGAVLQVSGNGTVDIGYNSSINNTSSVQPSFAVQVDVNGTINSTVGFQIDGQTLTYMPTGSVIMWSGWSDDLPDGWAFCVGASSYANGTAKCNMLDRFVIGHPPSSNISVTPNLSEYDDTWGPEDSFYPNFSSSSTNHLRIPNSATTGGPILTPAIFPSENYVHYHVIDIDKDETIFTDSDGDTTTGSHNHNQDSDSHPVQHYHESFTTTAVGYNGVGGYSNTIDTSGAYDVRELGIGNFCEELAYYSYDVDNDNKTERLCGRGTGLYYNHVWADESNYIRFYGRRSDEAQTVSAGFTETSNGYYRPIRTYHSYYEDTYVDDDDSTPQKSDSRDVFGDLIETQVEIDDTEINEKAMFGKTGMSTDSDNEALVETYARVLEYSQGYGTKTAFTTSSYATNFSEWYAYEESNSTDQGGEGQNGPYKYEESWDAKANNEFNSQFVFSGYADGCSYYGYQMLLDHEDNADSKVFKYGANAEGGACYNVNMYGDGDGAVNSDETSHQHTLTNSTDSGTAVYSLDQIHGTVFDPEDRGNSAIIAEGIHYHDISFESSGGHYHAIGAEDDYGNYSPRATLDGSMQDSTGIDLDLDVDSPTYQYIYDELNRENGAMDDTSYSYSEYDERTKGDEWDGDPIDHRHADSAHTHLTIDVQPKYYNLAFIMLCGDDC